MSNKKQFVKIDSLKQYVKLTNEGRFDSKCKVQFNWSSIYDPKCLKSESTKETQRFKDTFTKFKLSFAIQIASQFFTAFDFDVRLMMPTKFPDSHCRHFHADGLLTNESIAVNYKGGVFTMDTFAFFSVKSVCEFMDVDVIYQVSRHLDEIVDDDSTDEVDHDPVDANSTHNGANGKLGFEHTSGLKEGLTNHDNKFDQVAEVKSEHLGKNAFSMSIEMEEDGIDKEIEITDKFIIDAILSSKKSTFEIKPDLNLNSHAPVLLIGTLEDLKEIGDLNQVKFGSLVEFITTWFFNIEFELVPKESMNIFNELLSGWPIRYRELKKIAYVDNQQLNEIQADSLVILDETTRSFIDTNSGSMVEVHGLKLPHQVNKLSFYSKLWDFKLIGKFRGEIYELPKIGNMMVTYNEIKMLNQPVCALLN